MTDSSNQLDDDGDHSHILDQSEIDAMNMKELNQANRFYRKCLAGKCPPVVERRVNVVVRKKKDINFTSKKIQDKKLSQIWVESGRERRCQIMEDELEELDKKIKVAKGKTHLADHENNFKAIEQTIMKIEEIDEEIIKAKSDILHVKSQIDRVAQKKVELSRETESEGKNRDYCVTISSWAMSFRSISNTF